MFRPAFRLTRLTLHLLQGVATAGFVFPFASKSRERRLIQNWSAKLLAILGVELKVTGSLDSCERPMMIVANHVSWLDIFAINAICPARFVAKSEIRAWPVVGWLCARAGTLFIARSTPTDVKRINHEVAGLLVNAEVVAVFPEGRTTDGTAVAPFHAPLLQPASAAQAKLWPIAVRYFRPDGSLSEEASFAGDRSFSDSLRAILGEKRIIATLQLLASFPAGSLPRRELGQRTRLRITQALDSPTWLAQFTRSEPETRGDLQAAPPSTPAPIGNHYRGPSGSVAAVNPEPTNARKLP